MTEQTKFLIAGFFFLFLLVAALAFMKGGKTDAVSSAVSSSVPPVSSSAGEKVAGQLKKEPSKPTPSQTRRNTASRETPIESAVPQAQIDLVRKREEARIRRDEMMEVRAQTIKDLGPGNTGESQQ